MACNKWNLQCLSVFNNTMCRWVLVFLRVEEESSKSNLVALSADLICQRILRHETGWMRASKRRGQSPGRLMTKLCDILTEEFFLNLFIYFMSVSKRLLIFLHHMKQESLISSDLTPSCDHAIAHIPLLFIPLRTLLMRTKLHKLMGLHDLLLHGSVQVKIS